jgi:D-alanine-D-alanine ligase
MRVGFVYNVRGSGRATSGYTDEEAEFDDPAAIDAIRAAIAAHGHDVIDFEANETLPATLVAAPVDVVFNIAEGRGPRSREAQVPALLELLGIPYTGSDAVTLGITLDKSLAKSLVQAVGVATPRGVVMSTGDEPWPTDFPFPAIVKPLHEGSSIGITDASVALGEDGARERARALIAQYRQSVLCEEYVAGREVTAGLLGSPARVLPPMEIVFLGETAFPVYSFEVKRDFEVRVRYEVPAKLSPDELDAIETASLRAFQALGCRDVARLDFRLDASGVPYFLECNPLPGLAPGVGDLTFIAEAAGISFEDLIGEILEGALRRRL